MRGMLDTLYLDAPARTLAIELAAFVRDKAAPGERFPGTTEVLESSFGKFKAMEQHHSRSGFTHLVLTLGALVSHTTADVVAKALEAVPTRQVLDWCRTAFGTSVQSLRKLVYHPHPIPETEAG